MFLQQSRGEKKAFKVFFLFIRNSLDLDDDASTIDAQNTVEHKREI